MDTLTHGLLPLAAALALRRRVGLALAAAVGGVAPDLDGLWFFAVDRLAPGAFAWSHRGWSHTAWGGALLAVGLLALLTTTPLTRRLPRLATLERSRAGFAAAVLGSLSHTVFLDPLTITGTPAFWPATAERFGVDLYFFSEPAAALASLCVVALALGRRVGARGVKLGALVVVAILVVAGGVRVASRPAEPEGGLVWPTPVAWRWVVVAPAGGPDAWRVSTAGWGALAPARTYAGNATAEAADAVAGCRATGERLAERWAGSGAEVVDAVRTPAGWRVWIHDAAWRYVDEAGAFGASPFGEPERFDADADAVRCDVEGGAVVDVRRPVGFWG